MDTPHQLAQSWECFFSKSFRTCFLWLRDGNLQMEGTPLAQFTLYPNSSAMPLCNGFDDSQTQPRAALRQRLTIGAAIKLFEQTRQVTRGNANACILNGERQRVWRSD